MKNYVFKKRKKQIQSNNKKVAEKY